MHPARFVTYGFLYFGVLLLLQYLLLYRFRLDVAALVYLFGGAIFLVMGLYRLLSPREERYPEEHGLTTYAFALLLVFVTAVFALQFLVL